MKKIGFIGAGNLATSVIKGLKQSGAPFDILAYDIQREKTQELAALYGVRPAGLADIVRAADIIVLAVKPKDIKSLLSEAAGYDLKHKLIITVAAGVPLGVYEQMLPETAVVRVMPNTSCAVLESVTGMVRGKAVSDDQAQSAEQIFGAVGKVLWVEDREINALTAVSGSGPAYFYLLTELMALAGVELGLPPEKAQFLAAQTLVGAGRMMAESGKSPQELREAVTSPNGTTDAAITSFRAGNLGHSVHKAMLACHDRAEEMEGEYAHERH